MERALTTNIARRRRAYLAEFLLNKEHEPTESNGDSLVSVPHGLQIYALLLQWMAEYWTRGGVN
jgi:hypothetical protein